MQTVLLLGTYVLAFILLLLDHSYNIYISYIIYIFLLYNIINKL